MPTYMYNYVYGNVLLVSKSAKDVCGLGLNIVCVCVVLNKVYVCGLRLNKDYAVLAPSSFGFITVGCR